MKEFWDYIVKNKYIIICVAIVVALYAFGVVDFLAKIIVLLLLIALAVFIGKKLQDDENISKSFKKVVSVFSTKKYKDSNGNVYYYQEQKPNDSEKAETKKNNKE